MGKNDVNVQDCTATSGDAQRAWLEVIGVMKQMQTEIGRLGQGLEGQSRRMTNVMDATEKKTHSLLQSFNRFRQTMGIINGVRQAFGLLTQEMEAAKVVGERLLTPRLSYENEMASMLASVPAADFEKIRQEVEKYSGAIDRGAVAAAVRATSSTAGLGLPKQDIARAVVQTADIFPFLASDPTALQDISTAGVMLYNASKSLQGTQADGTPDFNKVLGFMTVALEKAAQKDPQKFAQYTVPAAKTLIEQYGYTPQEAFAELAATQTEAGDVSGRMGATTARLVASQMSAIGARYGVGDVGKRVPAVKQWLQEGKTDAAQKARTQMLGAFDALIEEEAKNGALAGMSFTDAQGHLQGAARYKGLYRDLLQNQGRVSQLYRSTIRELDPGAVAGEMAAKENVRQTSPFFARWRAEQRRLGSEGERQEMSTGNLLDYADFMRELEGIYDAFGVTGVDRSVRTALHGGTSAFPWRQNPAEYRLRLRETIAHNMSRMTGMSNATLLTLQRPETIEKATSGMSEDEKRNFFDMLSKWNELGGQTMKVHIVGDDVRDRAPAGANPYSPAQSLGE